MIFSPNINNLFFIFLSWPIFIFYCSFLTVDTLLSTKFKSEMSNNNISHQYLEKTYSYKILECQRNIPFTYLRHVTAHFTAKNDSPCLLNEGHVQKYYSEYSCSRTLESYLNSNFLKIKTWIHTRHANKHSQKIILHFLKVYIICMSKNIGFHLKQYSKKYQNTHSKDINKIDI